MSPSWVRHSVAELIADKKLVIGDGYRAKNQELSREGLPFARAGNIGERFHFEDADSFPVEHLSRVGNKVSHPGDVVFTSKGTVGRFAFVLPSTPRFVYSPQLCFWRSLDEETINPRFLYYWMQSREFFEQYKGVASQTDMAEYVSLSDQRRMHITLPTLAEQRRIAHILGTLDDKIELNRRMNQTLEEIARALFTSWFVDFDPVRAKAEGRQPEGMDADTARLFPNEVETSELGRIPTKWTVQPLGKLTSYLNRGISPSYLDAGGVLVLNQKCIREHRIDTSKGRRHNPDIRSVAGRHLQIGDVLVNSTGVGTLGRIAQVLALTEPTIVDSHVTVVRPDLKQVTSEYFGQVLLSRESEIESLGEGSTGQTELSRHRLSRVQLLVPPMPVMLAFSRLTQPALQEITVNDAESRSLASIRDLLLPRLLSGELKVQVAEAMAEEVR